MGQFCSNTFTTLLLVIIICASSLIQGSEGNKRPTQKNPCTKPIGVVNHAAIHPDYQNEETFKHRDRIRYECLPGFLKEGDLSQECQDGKWTSVQGKCKPGRTCSKPADVANANLRSKYRDIETFTESSEVEYDCNIGYSITGRSRNRKCLKSGNWSPVEFDCELIRCTYLPHPENGRRTDANNGAGETTRFSCNPGYTLKGPSQLVCRTDGEWSPRYTPKCEPILCPELSSLRNGDIFQDTSDGVRNNYGSIAQYTCNYGFTINGTRSRQINRRCEADGTWDGHNYFCDTEKCEPIEFYGGNLQYFGSIHRSEGTYAYYSCHDGYTMSPPGIDYSECKRTSLRWEPEPPKCYGNCRFEEYQPIDSSVVWRQRARTDRDAIIHGEKIIYSCTNQRWNELCVRPNDHDLCTYYLENFETTCINGTFDKINRDTLITCPEKRCSITYQTNTCVWSNGENCIKENYKIQSQSSVNVKCNDGNRYELFENIHKRYHNVDSSTMKCDRGNLLTDLSCLPKRCDMSDIPTNRFTSRTPDKSHIMHDDQIVYRCINDQYELYVNSTNSFPRAFTSTCRFGDFDVPKQNFPMCIERRCNITYQTSVFAHACFWTDDDHGGQCKPENFKIASGSSVNIGCKDGYELYDPIQAKYIDLERSEMTCIKGQYSKNLSCKRKRCALSHLPMNNFTIRTPEGTHIEHGQSISYTCKKPDDYELYVDNSDTYTTSFSARCNLGHITTSLQEFPLCVEKHCEFRPKVGVCFQRGEQCHSRRFDLKSQDSIKIKCTDRYKLISESGDEGVETATIKCIKGKPEEDIYCAPERKLERLIEHVAEVGGSMVAKVSDHLCSYSIFERLCSDSCLPDKIENGVVTDTDTDAAKVLQEVEDGIKVYTQCNKGYDRVGRSDNTCKNGEWKYSFPQCIPKQCLKIFQDGEIVWHGSNKLSRPTRSNKTYTHGTYLKIECASGYTMETQSQDSEVMTTVCVRGVWEPQPTCVPKSCAVPAVSNAVLKSKGTLYYNHTEEVRYECKEGYHFEQEYSKVKKDLRTERHLSSNCEFGNWSKQMPERCYPDGCILSILAGSRYFIYENNTKTEILYRDLIPHGTNVSTECTAGYDMVKKDSSLAEDFFPRVICSNGNWTNIHLCKKRCAAINDARVFNSSDDNVTLDFRHGDKAKIKCITGDIEVTCNDGRLKGYDEMKCQNHEDNDNDVSTDSKPDPANTEPQGKDDHTTNDSCKLLIMAGTRYYINEYNTNNERTESGLIPHGTNVSIECNTGYDMVKLDGSSPDNSNPQVTCSLGSWKNIHLCKKRCAAINSSRVISSSKDDVTQDFKHGDTAKIKCIVGVIEVKCDDGTLKGYDEMKCQNNEENDNDVSTNSKRDPENTGCYIPSDPLFNIYDTQGGQKLKPKTYIEHGTTLFVDCTNMDAEYNDHSTDIQCLNGLLENVRCPESFIGVTHECELTNGQVRKKLLNEVHISCDEGYLLNQIEKNKTCECTATGLDCKSVPNPPTCDPENCKIPEKKEHDSGLTIYVPIDGSDVGLSSGMEVKHGDSINFKCSYSETEHLELDYTRLECMMGKWLKVATNEEWLKLNSSDFPKCRTAICIPLCENGGKCVRDDTCECRPQSTGKRCEKVECDRECDKNGGKCIAPGKCGQCPHGKSGINCQDQGCPRPGNVPIIKDPKENYNIGETIDSAHFVCSPNDELMPRKGMSCLAGGWTDTAECIPKIKYVIQIQTGPDTFAGTGDKVYVNLHGDKYSTGPLNVRGSYAQDSLDEENIWSVDVTPIRSITVSKDSSWPSNELQVNYVSIFVEKDDHYYVFDVNNNWITDQTGKEIELSHHPQQCVHTFRRIDDLYPSDKHYNNAFNLGRGSNISLRTCKQMCVLFKKEHCNGVYLYKHEKMNDCWGFVDTRNRYFIKKTNTNFYRRSCL